MKYTNVQWIIRAPLYTRKPHSCPDCGTLVSVVKQERIVRAGSEEARRMGVSSGPGKLHFSGNVKVVWKVFSCPACGKEITIDEMKRHEGIPV